MLKLYFLHTISHNSEMLRFILIFLPLKIIMPELWVIVCKKNIILTLLHFSVSLYELFVISRTWIALRLCSQGSYKSF